MIPAAPPKGTMNVVRFGSPPGWDEEAYGKCATLPVVVQDGVYYSYWYITWKETLCLLLGGRVRLAVWGGQPPVGLDAKSRYEA